MSKTEHRISYKAGITRTPSDFLCEDGELAECINLTTDNEELKVVPQPEVMFDGAEKNPLIYVHEGSNYKNYITLADKALAFFDAASNTGDIDTMSTTARPLITHIGNILVVSDGDRMQYYLWKPDTKSYKSLGNKIPEPVIEFAMVYGNWGTPNRSAYNCGYSGDVGDCLEFYAMPNPQADYAWHAPRVKNQGQYNDLVIGLYTKSLNGLAENKLFTEPFVIRYALELYDGSYTYLSAPIMMFPHITGNCYADYFEGSLRMNVYGLQLAFKATFDYSEWSDIVKGVTVFASDGVNLYDLGTDQDPRPGYGSPYASDGTPTGTKWQDGIMGEGGGGGYNTHTHTISSRTYTEHSMKYYSSVISTNRSFVERGFWEFLPLNSRSYQEILDDMQSASVFYKLFEAGIKGHDKWESSKSYIKSHVLDNLTTQDQLNTDDYYSRCPLVPQFLMSYNSRLHLAGVSRGFFDGYEIFLPFDNNAGYSYDVYVYIKTPSGTRVVKKSYTTYEKMGIYFFYPDPRAYQAIIFLAGAWLCTLELKEHPSLNGAYYMRLPVEDDANEQTGTLGNDIPTQAECEAAVNETAESLSNQIFTSEVNNPFVFTYKGNKTIGTGNIVALATLTTAISQGQFGQHPVIVFSTDGIWAMEVTKEGYLNPAQPMSREVCINANTILETDGAVFFASKKGLMIIVGNQRNLDVKCVSGQMNGKAFSTAAIPSTTDSNDWSSLITSCADTRGFLQFIRDSSCFLAYDYIDNRILIINPSYTYSYLFSMVDGSVSKMVIPSGAVRAVRSYPDYLLQSSDGKVWSLYDKKDETELSARQQAFLLTRPMKMSGPVTVKSLRELVNVGYWDKKAGSSVKTLVFVSDNLVDWYDMESRFGAAAKYFRVALYINMLPTERLSGTIYWDQERRDENARVNT